MKKILAMLLVLGLFSPLSHAAPAYGTRMPQKGKLHARIQTHNVFDNQMEGAYSETHSVQHFVGISYGATDWLSIDLKAGTGNIHLYPDQGEKLSYASRFAGGYGFRIKAYDKEKVKVVVGFQHISVHPWEDWSGGDKYQSILDDWQGSALVSYEFQKITPYVGLKAGRMDYTYWVNEHDRNRVKSDETRMFGLILGLDIDVRENMWINAEMQFRPEVDPISADATAFAVSMNVAF